ncbi:hypothetical protein M427DRAFT_48926 [Gonapodya prolifera JEL478]|uniref:Cas12f1-like TNB domain-containing protein n=1 Tax=Gonapodya prolifera (strain JEL478) TaxID=1344416 RepID=A0A138ZZF2_GONPJ|nr:hypothetical protein M427DRAFT_48926 [Gonapodya prolifera JEL478]|eukprot:KXS09892.1 hypothetical protein M427DRAFT_48926 [Gonapodya prolifera JEL478]
MPILSMIENPISKSSWDENCQLWPHYLEALRFLLSDLEARTSILVAEGKSYPRPPRKFSLAPIYGFKPHHIMLDERGCRDLHSLHVQLGNRRIPAEELHIRQIFNVRAVENLSEAKQFAGTLTTNGLKVCIQKIMRIPRVDNSSGDGPSFESVELNDNTIVVAMDPNKPGGTVAGGPVSESGVKPSYCFDVSRNEYYHSTGLRASARRLKRYLKTGGWEAMQSSLPTAKTTNYRDALKRLEQFSLVARELLVAYRDSSCTQDNWNFSVARNRVLHRFARRISHLGQRDEKGQDFDFVRNSNRVRRRRKSSHREPVQEPERRDIVFVTSDLSAPERQGISGTTMLLKLLCSILHKGDGNRSYVRAVVNVGEDRTSQECNNCHHHGVPTVLTDVHIDGKKIWRIKRCAQCQTYWNRDICAALNIRSVWLFGNSHNGMRPGNFVRGYRGHPA